MTNKYSYQGEETKTARATVRDANASWKHLNEICHAIKGMNVDKAIKYLNTVVEMKDHIPMRRYNTGVPHRVGGQPGRYLTKTVKIMIKLVENAKANADFKGMKTENLKIVHATASKAGTIHRIKSKGKSHTMDIDLANAELVLREV